MESLSPFFFHCLQHGLTRRSLVNAHTEDVKPGQKIDRVYISGFNPDSSQKFNRPATRLWRRMPWR
jgi:hypothetical protein